jgi:putrescine aminotransferase
MNRSVKKLLEWDKNHLIRGQCPIGENKGIMFEKGKGVKLQDAEGKEYLDFCSHLSCCNLGYGNKELVAAAAEQMQKLSYSTIFFGFSHRPSIECGMKLAELTPQGLDHFFFTSGGSESVEQALKIARIYWSNQGKHRYKIISLYGSYHGVSFGAISATGTGKGHFWQGITPTVPGFIHIPPYYCYRCIWGEEYPRCGIRCAKHLAEVIENEGPETVAAFIAEPVIGAGGMVPPPKEYWPIVREICSKYGVLLIADEVMTGFCRTGKTFTVEHWKVKPDMMTMAKGITSTYLPLGVLAINERIYEGIKGIVPSGFTNDGHPVCCALAITAMNIYIRDKLADNAAKVGQHILDRLNAEFKPLPCVGEITGLGLMGGIEIVADKATKRVFAPELNITENIKRKAFENGLYLRSASFSWALGDRVEYDPPIVITMEEANRALDILKPIIAEIKPS